MLAGHLNAVHAAIVELVADALADESWGGDGVRSPQQWLTWQLAITTNEADRILDLAMRVPPIRSCRPSSPPASSR